MEDFNAYVRDRGPALMRFGFMVTGDRTAAEDAVQEALSRAFPRWDRIGRVADVDAYVRRMIVNAHISWWRKWNRESAVEEVRDVNPLHAPDHADLTVEHERMWELLKTLPKRQRTALVLRHYEGLPDKEIAAAMGCSEQTVRSQISRALVTLRGRLSAEGAQAHD